MAISVVWKLDEILRFAQDDRKRRARNDEARVCYGQVFRPVPPYYRHSERSEESPHSIFKARIGLRFFGRFAPSE
jgi:hypothetical protein